MDYKYDKNNVAELMNKLKAGDTVTVMYEDFINLIENKLSTHKVSLGRKPIKVDNSLFEKVVEDWQNGKISAREAMRLLDLKPNTFYRRIKEKRAARIENIKEELSQAKYVIDTDRAEMRRDLHDIGEQIRSDAKEVCHNIEELKFVDFK